MHSIHIGQDIHLFGLGRISPLRQTFVASWESQSNRVIIGDCILPLKCSWSNHNIRNIIFFWEDKSNAYTAAELFVLP